MVTKVYKRSLETRQKQKEARHKFYSSLEGKRMKNYLREVAIKMWKTESGAKRKKEMSIRIKKAGGSKALEYLKKTGGIGMHPKNGKYEKEILDKMQVHYKWKIIRNFFIAGYYLDGYVKELNIAIEIDEPIHYRRKEKILKDKKREKIIKDALGCYFLRIKEECYLDNLESNNIYKKRYPFIFEHEVAGDLTNGK